jgi:hypothetical protein
VVQVLYEMPPRPNNTERHFVIPSALQMGWTNSSAYFCNATEASREIARRLLALSVEHGILPPHELEHHCAPGNTNNNTNFIDNYVKAVAGPPSRSTRHHKELWVTRAILHAIHSLFPGPTVTGHINGRDIISLKKLLALDGLFDILKIFLGFLLDGRPGCHRTVGHPADKAATYINAIQEALDSPRHYISFQAFQKIHGKLVHASSALPCMGGFMSVFNKILGAPGNTVGLGRKSPLCPTLQDFIVLLHLANVAPSHITKIVGADMPHVYGYTDASRVGMGGVILPSTRWIPPTVWRAKFPSEIVAKFDSGSISINDLEMAANFVAERLVEHLLHGEVEGINSWFGCDNTTTVSWKRKKAAGATVRSTYSHRKSYEPKPSYNATHGVAHRILTTSLG